ncbi:hypothetical protein Prudu_012574 [Prunus dulcis]|uniref:Uncharacterized protein n=1 Tax=Prunus dulcis TaxID=3755 RepID=A0A4Y1RDQ4_PRUDU|nr:hypothetical protein Prudu_012574 [Prunus dulcis]
MGEKNCNLLLNQKGAAESGSKQQQQQPNRVDMDRKRKRKIVTTLVAVELEKQHLCASMMLVTVIYALTDGTMKSTIAPSDQWSGWRDNLVTEMFNEWMANRATCIC